ncbi:MAG: hypothetical protein MUO27_04410, partial [Sedimentisphaerales bacterium]|nr:hypothetical protein [Sedimentisphaerales bacterium]
MKDIKQSRMSDPPAGEAGIARQASEVRPCRRGRFFCLLFSKIFAVCCLLLIGDSAFSSDSNEPELPIGSIEVVGVRSVASTLVLSEVRSRVGELFDAQTAAADARRIAELPGVENSYYNTAVVDGKIKLTFVVVE